MVSRSEPERCAAPAGRWGVNRIPAPGIHVKVYSIVSETDKRNHVAFTGTKSAVSPLADG